MGNQKRDEEVDNIVNEIRGEGYVPPATVSDSVRDAVAWERTTPDDFDTTNADAAELILAETQLSPEQMKLVAGGATEIQHSAIPTDDAELAVEQGYVDDAEDAGKIFMDETPPTPIRRYPVAQDTPRATQRFADAPIPVTDAPTTTEETPAPEVPTVETPTAEEPETGAEEEVEYDDDGNPIPKEEKIVTAWHSEFPMSEHAKLFEDFHAFELHNLITVPPVASKVIAEWTLEGDPSDVKSYLALDVAVLSVIALEMSAFFVEQRLRTRDVEIEFFDDYPLKKHPTIIGDLARMDGMKFSELPKVLRQTVKSWNLPGSWKERDYLYSLDAFLVAKIYSAVRNFWNQRLFTVPKPSKNASKSL